MTASGYLGNVSRRVNGPIARLAGLAWPQLATHREPLLEALGDVLAGSPADRVLARLLRRTQAEAPSRAVLAEAVFGVSLWRRRLAALLGSEAPSPEALLYAFLLDRAGLSPLEAASASGLGAPFRLSGKADAFADAYSLPDWLAAELSDLPGGEALAAALNAPGPVSIRANRLKVSRDALHRLLDVETQPLTRTADGLRFLKPPPNILGMPAHQSGLFEVQDEGSQLVGEMLQARPGETLLDFCAGAGGKTLQLAAALGNRGTVWAHDIDSERLGRLDRRAARAGASCIRILRTAPPAPLRAQGVLVDAPCSELGALRRGPDVRFRINPRAFAGLPARQLAILEQAARHVTPTGRLVYATCTFRRAENEEVVAELCRRRPDFHPEETLSLWPHRDGTDGFFAVRLKRAG